MIVVDFAPFTPARLNSLIVSLTRRSWFPPALVFSFIRVNHLFIRTNSASAHSVGFF